MEGRLPEQLGEAARRAAVRPGLAPGQPPGRALDRIHQYRAQPRVGEADRHTPAEERRDEHQPPALEEQVLVHGIVHLKDRGQPPHGGAEPGEEPFGAALQQRPRPDGAVGVHMGLDEVPVRGERRLVVAAQRAGDPAQHPRIAVAEQAHPRGGRASGGQALDVGPQPGPRGGQQRVHALLKPARAFRGRQEVGEIAPGREEGQQRLVLPAQAGPGPAAPFVERERALPALQLVNAERDLPHGVRVRRDPDPADVFCREMDT